MQVDGDIPAEIEKALRDMPAISPVLGRINSIAQEMETSPRDLVRIIMLDPVLTGKVLRLVNSSFYGLTQRVRTLAQAVVYLGVNTVKNLAISTALLSTVFVKNRQSPLHPEEFWRHCLATAVASRLLAGSARSAADTVEMHFIAGLLHDVGKILLIRTHAARYGAALAESTRLGVSLAFAEEAHFGMSHARAGGILARRWKLDGVLAAAIEGHHRPRAWQEPGLSGVVMVANSLCKRCRTGDSGNGILEEAERDIVRQLGLPREAVARAAAMVPQEVDKAAEFLHFMQDQEQA
jgi:HD-like signal output (HDOD) protein